MPLATDSDVQARLGRTLTPAELARVPGLIDEASDLITGFLRPRVVPDPVPDVLRRVVSRMVARVLESPAGDVGMTGHQMSAGPFQVGHTYMPDSRTGGPWLTKQDKIALRPYTLGAVSVRTW
ncbi:hypothetical protein [Nocardia terpenica]|uniref:Head-to-tail adaptor n=1 Tax=Nocardia terpenica TaxID=455432 RepID=A0A291RU52_9NOCA|nr:hypothetical protein [Nocardia terpenica]ATL70778.1 hypothetical protein CRH09_35950 [Nocardia terpenica]